MNNSWVIIVLIICVTLIVLAWIGKDGTAK